MEQAAKGIILCENQIKIELICFNKDGVISLNGKHLKFVVLSSNISSTEIDVIINTEKAWTAVGWLLTIEKSNLADKIK